MAKSSKKLAKAVKARVTSKTKSSPKKSVIHRMLTAEGWRRLMMKKYRKTKKS